MCLNQSVNPAGSRLSSTELNHATFLKYSIGENQNKEGRKAARKVVNLLSKMLLSFRAKSLSFYSLKPVITEGNTLIKLCSSKTTSLQPGIEANDMTLVEESPPKAKEVRSSCFIETIQITFAFNFLRKISIRPIALWLN